MARRTRGYDRAERAATLSEGRSRPAKSVERYRIDLGDAEEPLTPSEAFFEVTGCAPDNYRGED